MVAQGFVGQRLIILPAAVIRSAERSPVTQRMLVTDVGYYPRAREHNIVRPMGTSRVVVLLCTEGEGWVQARDRPRVTIRSGDVAILPPGVPHSYGAHHERPWTIFWLHAQGVDLGEFFDAHAMSMTAVLPLAVLSRATDLIDEIIHILGRDLTWTSLRHAAGAAWHLLALLTGVLATDHTRIPPGRSATITAVIEAIRSSPAMLLNVAKLAATINLSTSHFETLFTRATGMPVIKFQTSIRMARARILLDAGALSIAEIALETGYADPSYFTRQFTRLHGRSPSVYRADPKG